MSFSREVCAARLHEGVVAMGLMIPDEAQSRLLDYLELLDKWNQAYNLTAIRHPLEMVDKHLLDSLSLLPHIEKDQLLDVGAGAGLPGLVLAIVRPELRVTTVDAVAKKVRFMEHVIRTLKLANACALHARVEALRGNYAQITSRAFARLVDFLQLTRHLLAPGGRWLAMKGHIPQDEIQDLPGWAMVVDTLRLKVPAMLGERHLVVLADGNAEKFSVSCLGQDAPTRTTTQVVDSRRPSRTCAATSRAEKIHGWIFSAFPKRECA